MNPLALVESCEQARVFLCLNNGKVKAYGREADIAQYLPLLKAHKEALKAFLICEDQEFFDERAAIAEYCGGLSRIDAEAQAAHELLARQDNRKFH